MFRELTYDSEAYWETIKLRHAILRAPLNLEFTEQDFELDQDSHHLTLSNEGELVACLALSPHSHQSVRMRQLAVRENAQRKGYGKSLVLHAEEYSKALGYTSIFARARENALPFYEKLHYQIEGEPFIELSLVHYKIIKAL